MRLLIITQKVDRNDPILGFFHRWIEEFAKRYEKVTAICLKKGEYSLPPNVKVLSLGKPYFAKASQGAGKRLFSRIIYLINFYKYIYKLRNDYDAVFVHMNQEYVLLAGDFWRLLGKKIYLWRNHARGNLLTRLAVLLSHKVFYTSPQSFTARFNSPRRSLWRSAGKSIQMPAGIDTDFYRPDPLGVRIPNSFLFLGRIAPVKKVLEFVEWFNKLDEKFQATVAGSALPKDKDYEELVQSRVSDRIKFIGAVSQEEARSLYQSHETYVNFTPAGSYDKTILEAAACGTKVIVENPDLKNLENKNGEELRKFVMENHSLIKLFNRLQFEL